MHSGEVKIAKRMGIPHDPVDRRYSRDMPEQHMIFFSDLPYFIFGNLDSQGRPWVSILTGQRGFITATSHNNLKVNVEANKWDPVVRNLKESEEKFKKGDGSTVLFSGLGVDFSNRRRNKVAGEIEANTIHVGDGKDKVNISLLADTKQSLGNCPKYINIRALKHFNRENPELVHDVFNVPSDFEGLPEESKNVILQADAIFISTRHLTNSSDLFPISDMDVNIRGGPPGFVRVMPGGKQIIWPDYSGNRLYQSLGNIESDHKVGMVIPNFNTGDMVFITGEAENIYGDEAASLLPSCSLVTLVTITGYVMIKGGLDIVQTSDQIAFSPYNPPVRYLRSESSLHPLSRDPVSHPLLISDVKRITPNIHQYTFTVPLSPSSSPSPSTAFIPGQHILVDFSKAIPKRYSHMNEAKPQRLNDDFVRSWTISSSPSYLSPSTSPTPSLSVSCTIKLKESGEITPFLHYYASLPASERPPLPLFHRGINGSFSVFNIPLSLEDPSSPPPLTLENDKLLFIAGGIGATPFLSFHSSLRLLPGLRPDISVLFSCRSDEIVLVNNFFDVSDKGELTLSPFVSEIQVFQTGNPTEHNYPNTHSRRLTKEDIAKVTNLKERTSYICGPDNFMKDVNQWLSELGVHPNNVKQERFDF